MQANVRFEHQLLAVESEHTVNGMLGWPRDILTDRHNLLVRVCADGIGHPDPDSLEWLHRIGVADDGDHACDGCCQEALALFRRGRISNR